MKFLQVIPNFNFGGAETMCENLIYALRNMEHEVTAVSLYNQHTPITDRMERQGVRILYLDKKLGLDLSMIPKLIKIIKQEKPDVVHTHLDVVKYAALAAKYVHVPYCIHTVHSVAEKEAEGIAQKINRVIFRLGWSVPVALSPQIQRTIGSVYGLTQEQIPVVYNGVDLSKCAPKTDYAVGESIKLVHVGRFDIPKNHAGMLRVFRKLHEKVPKCRLCFVGDGDLRMDVEMMAKELGIMEFVEFAGFQSDVHPFLHDADIFILPSLYEGIPMTIIEAMATGLPIVATNVGGIPDILQNQKNALLVACDEEQIYHACYQLVNNKDLREHLGKQAMIRSEQFSANKMAENYCSLCN